MFSMLRFGNQKRLMRAFRETIILLACAIVPMAVGAQEELMPGEIARDETKWPEPQIKAEWGLELMKHNCPNHNVFVYKDKLYDDLFTRTLGWNGGDGVETTLLPDGNVFWSFNDSFYGVVDADTRARRSCSFPRNSIMVQTVGDDGLPGTKPENLVWLADYVQTDNPKADRYYQARTHLRHPNGEKSDAEIARGDIDQQWLYWAGDATIFDGKMQMLWGGVYNGTENLMQNRNQALATYSLEGKPGDPGYLKIIAVDHHHVASDPVMYGSQLWEDEDGHTYLYACNQWKETPDQLLAFSHPVVARTKTHDLNSGTEYYIKDTNGEWHWQDTYPTNDERNRSGISQHSISTVWVFKKGDWYYMTGQGYVFGNDMYLLRSKNPWGPFDEKEHLWIFPNVLDKKGTRTYQNLYMPHLHMALSRQGELVFSTNTDAKNWDDNFNSTGSADFYRPYFIRVYNWEAVFDK